MSEGIRIARVPLVRIALGLIAACVMALLLSHSAGAQGSAGGSGGTGSGGTGAGYSYQYKYGWYVFNTNSSGPSGGLRNGDPWSSVQSACNAVGADKVIGFVYHNSAGDQKIYTWTGENNPANYKTGTNYISIAQMYIYYNSTGGIPGYTMGSNIGWFCYNSNPGWSLSVTSYSSVTSATSGYTGSTTRTVSPGQTVWFKHRVTNSGPGQATYQRWLQQKYNASSWSNQGSSYPITSTRAANSSIDYPTSNSTKSFKIPDGAPDGALYCERYRITPRSNTSSSTIYSQSGNGICVRVSRPWVVTPQISVNVPVANGTRTTQPGNTVTWTHSIRNTGSYSTDRDVQFAGRNSGYLGNLTLAGGAWNVSSGFGAGSTSPRQTTSYRVDQDDVGNTLCRVTRTSRTSNSNTNKAVTSPLCVSVPYNYALNPTITVPATEAEVGSTITVQPRVSNTGVTKSRTAQWVISYVVAPVGSGGRAASNTGTSPCGYYGVGGRTCTTASFSSGGSGSGSRVFNPGGYNVGNRTATIGDQPVGTQICYGLSVKDRSSGSTQWRHSALDCVVISKRPVTQVIGGDLIVGRGSTGMQISTNTKTVNNRQYGSWGEYAVSASGLISGMASASGYAGGVTPSNLCGVSYLSFSNRVGSSGCSAARIGNYSFRAASATIASRFPTSSASTVSGNVGLDTLASDRVYTGTGTISLTAPGSYSFEPGKWAVINAPNATVRIMNNIRYTDDELSSLADIPQLVIIARNIIISDDVSQVDAWLVATGTGTNGRVNTCGASTTGPSLGETTALNSNRCNVPLTINGPVIANHLLMRRTAGAGTGNASGDPAEVFNLRPDAYLWATNLQTEGAKAQTVITTELPPRY